MKIKKRKWNLLARPYYDNNNNNNNCNDDDLLNEDGHVSQHCRWLLLLLLLCFILFFSAVVFELWYESVLAIRLAIPPPSSLSLIQFPIQKACIRTLNCTFCSRDGQSYGKGSEKRGVVGQGVKSVYQLEYICPLFSSPVQLLFFRLLCSWLWCGTSSFLVQWSHSCAFPLYFGTHSLQIPGIVWVVVSPSFSFVWTVKTEMFLWGCYGFPRYFKDLTMLALQSKMHS